MKKSNVSVTNNKTSKELTYARKKFKGNVIFLEELQRNEEGYALDILFEKHFCTMYVLFYKRCQRNAVTF